MYKCEICGKKTFIGAKVGKYNCLCPSCTIHVTNPPPQKKKK